MNAEASRLRELLVNAGVSGFRDVVIEEDAPDEVKALWGTLGWSDAFATTGLVVPDRVTGVARAKARLAAWRRQKMSTLTIDDLPARFRVIDDDGAGVGFGIVDETKKKPVVCAVLCDTNAVKRTRASYAPAVADRLVRHFYRGPFAQIDGPSKGEPLLPTLRPGLVAVGGGLVADVMPNGIHLLFFASATRLFEHLEALPSKTLGFVLPLGALPMFGRVDEVLERVTVTRTWSGTKKLPGKLVLGHIDGAPILVTHDGKACAIWGEDLTRIGAAFSGLARGARAWPMPGAGEWATFTDNAPPPRLDDATFANAVRGFAAVARALGRARVEEVPRGTPSRLAAVARESDEPLLEDALATEAWIPVGFERPGRHRRLAGGARGAERWVVVTDEDVASDDPPAVYYASHLRRAVLAGAHASQVFVRATLERWADGRRAGGWFPGGRPDAALLLDAFGVRVEQLGEGVLLLSNDVVFRDVFVYASYLATLDAPLLGSFQPPLESRRFPAPKPKKRPKKREPHPLVPARLVADGFRAAPIVSSTSRKGQTMGVGLAGDVPIWILHDENPRLSGVPTIVCAHEHATKAKAWAAKRVDRV